jgi:REP element-mobilizing transposase RayT
MPDHLHWLLELTGTSDLSLVIQAVKSVTAHRLGGKVWQDGFHDHALRKEEDVRTTARYVVANPLRARLVSRLGDYPHWDAIWL